jgi:ribonuclease-3
MAILKRDSYSMKGLEKILKYRFKNRELLEMALTHRSYRFENSGVLADNQRLEFLGDAVLDLVLAEFLYERFPGQGEGFLTSTRSRMVSGRGLARAARQVELGNYLRMGKGEEASGGRNRESNLADALESLIGAAYLDRGHKAARRIVAALVLPQLASSEGGEWLDNPKGKLQELSQRLWKQGPEYKVVEMTGPAHARLFTVSARLSDGSEARAEAGNKQAAEALAAARLLARRDEDGDVNGSIDV